MNPFRFLLLCFLTGAANAQTPSDAEILRKLASRSALSLSRESLSDMIGANAPSVLESLRILARPLTIPDEDKAADKRAREEGRKIEGGAPSFGQALALLIRYGDPWALDLVRSRYANYDKEPALFLDGMPDFQPGGLFEISSKFWGPVSASRHPDQIMMIAPLLEHRNGDIEIWKLYEIEGWMPRTGYARHIGAAQRIVVILSYSYDVPEIVRESAKAVYSKLVGPELWGDPRFLRAMHASVTAFVHENRVALERGRYQELTPVRFGGAAAMPPSSEPNQASNPRATQTATAEPKDRWSPALLAWTAGALVTAALLLLLRLRLRAKVK